MKGLRSPFGGLWPICRKEFTHVLRDRATLFFALFLPVMQLLVFGFAIDTNVRQITTVVYDEALTEQSRRLIEAFANTDTFRIARSSSSAQEMYEEIRAGRARVGVHIPYDYSRRLAEDRTATVLVLVDGSDSTVTSQAINVSNGIALRESLIKLAGDRGPLPIEFRPAVLFNPGTRSPNFFVPGLIAVLLQAMTIMLVAFSIVRERERGTLEQLSLTPVAPLGLMVGKMIPYGLLGFLELCTILTIMRIVFQVPVHGSLVALLLFSAPFLLTVLGLGLLISARARSQGEAFQLAMATLLPSVFLSGYIFLIENMPLPFQIVSKIVPATYYISILRGVILRGAGFSELWPQAAILLAMGCAAIGLAALTFVKRRAQ